MYSFSPYIGNLGFFPPFFLMALKKFIYMLIFSAPSYFIEVLLPIFVIFPFNYFGLNLSFFSSFLRSKYTSLIFFQYLLIKQISKTMRFSLRTVLAEFHKFWQGMLSSNFSSNVFSFFFWLLLWPKGYRNVLLNLKYFWFPRDVNCIDF